MGDLVGVEARELVRQLNALSSPDLAKKAQHAAADKLLEYAKADVPVRSGNLRGSLRVFDEGERTYVGSDLDYSAPIHFGWRRHHIQPNRFITENVDDHEQQLVEAASQVIAEELR